MTVDRKYERDIDLLLAEEFAVSASFATWFIDQTQGFKGIHARVVEVGVSRSDTTGESDLVVVYERQDNNGRFALHIEDKIDAPLQPEQEARYRRRGQAAIERGEYSAFEVILCSPRTYPLTHAEVSTFDLFVDYEAVSEFLKSQNGDDPRSAYRAEFVATAAVKTSNAWKHVEDGTTNAFWKAALEIALRDFPDLEMKPLHVTKGSTWITFRPLDMPTQPRLIYVSFKGDCGFMDLTFASCLARLTLPLVRPVLSEEMSVLQTGKSAAIRIVVEPIKICEPYEAEMTKVRVAFEACVRLIRFYRQNREILTQAVAASLPPF
jgi:hypothetical protein